MSCTILFLIGRVSSCCQKDLVLVSRLGIDKGSKMLCSQTSENFFFLLVFPFPGWKEALHPAKGRDLCSILAATWSCGRPTRALCKCVFLCLVPALPAFWTWWEPPSRAAHLLWFDFWILLSCRGWSISILFVWSLTEGACMLKHGGLGLAPNLSAITILSIFCDSVQHIWGKTMVKPSQRSIESASSSVCWSSSVHFQF